MPKRPLLLAVLNCSCLTAAGGALVQFVAVDFETGKPLPCRIHLKNAAGSPVHPKGLPFWHDHFVCGGSAELDIAPGRYTYEIDHGPEYLLATGAVTVAEANSPGVTNRLRRLANMAQEGWWSGDLHVHRPPEDMELLMRAEDLHVAPIITWWNTQNTWGNRPMPVRLVVPFDGDRFYHLMGGEDERGGGAL